MSPRTEAAPRVLLAEDDPSMRSLLAETLRRARYEVTEAATVDELRTELVMAMLGQSGQPAAIVTDRFMPGGDAMDLLADARSRGWRVPVLLVTAFADAAVFERALRLGRCIVLSKPVSMESLRAALSTLTGHAAAPLPKQGPRVLLAEDDEELRALMASTLRAAGAQVIEAADGIALADALDRSVLGDEPLPDVVVTDVQMPGMSGLRVLAGMRQNRWDVPALIVTGYGDDDVRRAASALECACVLEKPVEMDDLRRVVAWILREASARKRARDDIW